MERLSYADLAEAVDNTGAPFFDRGDYNLNLIGIRTDDPESELFNDYLMVAYRQNGNEQLWTFQMTTDPGVYWRRKPMHVEGTAIVVPGHYPGLWEIGEHQGRYQALVQAGPIKVYRDNNRDDILDYNPDTQDSGYFGINLHRTSRKHDPERPVGRWSAGCQVLASSDDFDLFMALAARAAAVWGDSFSYTLLTESQLAGETRQ